MFEGGQFRIGRVSLGRHLGLRLSPDPVSLHRLAYGDAEAPRHAHDSVFPPDEEVSVLFVQPLLSGTPRTLDRLTLVASTIHLALRRSLLFRQGYNEGLTALQQWLLIYILTG
ncbi:hypothetical protein C2845_PM05G06620 [Panicum miliaceum]|uniref:Uncharacterized protein n=1 Tax=Panicum miliaceum TaxID=4540 RepID=A0A3L6T067_PANMI|nr:hypothetical protein C2845_PM05G06620 [Panicum miliaceum]